MAALMTSYMGGDISQITRYTRNSIEMGIEVLPPDINESERDFAVLDGKIRYGLKGVKSIGKKSDMIIAIRETKGPEGFSSLLDFIKSVDLDMVTRMNVENLIKAGAFDRFEPNRNRHLAIFDTMLERVREASRAVVAGQVSMLDLNPELMADTGINIALPEAVEPTTITKLSWERDIVGIYLSGHPLDDYMDIIKNLERDERTFLTTDTLNRHKEFPNMDGKRVCMVLMVTHVRTQQTKRGDTMAFASAEDHYGDVEIVIFGKQYRDAAPLLQNGSVIIMRGKLSAQEDQKPNVRALRISSIDAAISHYRKQL
jgi:DNA polymerase-3 subunit alpha